MTLIAEVSLREDLILFEDTFAATPDAVCTFEDIHYLLDDADHTHYVFFWWVTGCAFDAFGDALADDPTVEDSRTVATIGDRRLYRVETTSFPPDQPLVFPTFRAHDVTTIEARRDADGLHLHARFPSRDALDAFLDAADHIAATATVDRLYRETAPAESATGLTDRQRDALAAAHDAGYFATPSEATLAEVAEDFGVTAQTLSRHIRVAVEKLVADAVERPAAPTPVHKDASE
jgi:predicted DNA binding protein